MHLSGEDLDLLALLFWNRDKPFYASQIRDSTLLRLEFLKDKGLVGYDTDRHFYYLTQEGEDLLPDSLFIEDAVMGLYLEQSKERGFNG